MIYISDTLSLKDEEVEISAIRAQGSGGQNVNKVSSAVHLRFDIKASSLSDFQKQQLLESKDRRINKVGVLVIKAQNFRTQEKNRYAAFERVWTPPLLQALCLIEAKVRLPTCIRSHE